jgi:hypothetical protein
VDHGIALKRVTTGVHMRIRNIVLPVYSSRVNFTVGTCILLESTQLVALGFFSPPCVICRGVSYHILGMALCLVRLAFKSLQLVLCQRSGTWRVPWSGLMARFMVIFSTTSSSVMTLVSTLSMAYCPVLSGIRATVETLVLKSLRPELTGPTSQRGHI